MVSRYNKTHPKLLLKLINTNKKYYSLKVEKVSKKILM